MHSTTRTLAAILLASTMAIGCDTGTAAPTPAAPSAAPPKGTPIAEVATAPPVATSAAPTSVPVATPTPTPSPTPGTLPPLSAPPLSSPCGRNTAAPSASAASIDSFRWTHKRKLPNRVANNSGGRLAPTSAGWVYWDHIHLDFSPDLIHWQGIELDGFTVDDDPWFDHFATAAGGSVAFGWITGEDPETYDTVERPALLASVDGRRWVDITDPAITSATIYSAGSTGCDLIVMGRTADGTPSVWTSPDGLAWTASTDPDVARLGTRTFAYATGPGRALAFAADTPE